MIPPPNSRVLLSSKLTGSERMVLEVLPACGDVPGDVLGGPGLAVLDRVLGTQGEDAEVHEG